MLDRNHLFISLVAKTLIAFAVLWHSNTSLLAQPEFLFIPSSESVELNEAFEVTFAAKDFTNVSGVQFTFNWNADIAEFQAFNPAFPTEAYAGNNMNTPSGVFSAFWNEVTSYTLPDTAILGTLVFKGIDNGVLNITIGNQPTTSLVAYENDNQEVVEAPMNLIQDGTVTVGESNAIQSVRIIAGISFYQNNPNPFSKNTYIPITLSKSTQVDLDIYDINGKIIFQHSNRYGEGTHRIKLNEAIFPHSGTYLYRIGTATNFITNKMILVR